MKIVAIAGSPRANGNTSYLVDEVLKEVSKFGIETQKIVVSQYRISPCQGHDECQNFTSCPQPDEAELVLQKLYEADGVILASPVYYFNVTAQLKALIDRSRFYRRHKKRMKARSVGIIIVAQGGGIEDTARALLNFIRLSSNVPTDKVIQVCGLAGTEGEIKSNTDVVEEARRLGRKMSEQLGDMGAG